MNTLDEISKKYDFILPDTSILSGYLHEKIIFGGREGVTAGNSQELLDYFVDNCNFLDKLKFFVESGEGGIYLTSLVAQEFFEPLKYAKRGIDPGAYAFFRTVRKNKLKVLSRANETKRSSFSKRRSKLYNKQRSLWRIFAQKGKILAGVENLPEYSSLKEKYSFLQGQFNLSETDFDLLLSGVVFAEAGESSAILSNDLKGIKPAWKNLLLGENLSYKECGFYFREKPFEFKGVVFTKARQR